VTSKSLLKYPEALTNQLRRLAIEAGEATLEYYDQSGYSNAGIKQDGSPVTAADQAAEDIICAGLEKISIDIPVIAEESVAASGFPDIRGCEYFWLVDALDGTKEFINGSSEYTVNIALIHNGVPVIGVVYAPAAGEMYAASGANKAVRWLAESNKEKSIRVRLPPKEGLTIVASRIHGSGEKMDRFLSNYKISRVIAKGSSLKICTIAAGKADMYPRFGPTCEWDTAAGHAVLRAAGGEIVDFSGAALTYGKHDNDFINPEFCAVSSGLRDGV
jgi:3'(2'), 5'-bisphosphate nucleotidase